MASKYHVGDVVQVVPTPYEDCPFNWTASMDKWLGRVVVITNCYHSAGYNADVYHIEPVPCESNQGFTPFSQTWSWCENCFVPVGADTTEEDFEVSEIDDLLGGDW